MRAARVVFPLALVAILGAGFVISRRPPEVALPSFAGAERRTQMYDFPALTTYRGPYRSVDVLLPPDLAWDEGVATIGRDLTAQGFRLHMKSREYATWKRGEESAWAMSRWRSGRPLTVWSFALSRPATFGETAALWLRRRLGVR